MITRKRMLQDYRLWLLTWMTHISLGATDSLPNSVVTMRVPCCGTEIR